MIEKPSLDYASAGVDTEAGDRAVELMKEAVSQTHNATVLGGAGGFAGMIDASALADMTRPLLATSTDGVGTKIALARAMDIHDTIGQDLVGMVVDDLVVVGARPLLMTDYIACGHVVPERIAAIVTGIARACAAVGCPLVGGETAEHPGVMDPADYDIAGAATGVVDEPSVIGPQRVHAGDVVIAMASSGLHSNGYSLVRRVLEVSKSSLDHEVADFGRTLGEELLEPTRLYTKVCLDLLGLLGVGEGTGLHALSHVTGGGLGANLCRVIPQGLLADVDRSTWTVPPVFDWVRTEGGTTWDGLEDALNLGVGMLAVIGEGGVDKAVEHLASVGLNSWVVGQVRGADDATRQRFASPRSFSGTKGVDGGEVILHGTYRVNAL